MQLEIITPETKIFSGDVSAAQFPGLDGLFQVLKGHDAIISALTNGDVKVDLSSEFNEEDFGNEFITVDGANRKVIRVAIKGGVVEMLDDKIIVLAD